MKYAISHWGGKLPPVPDAVRTVDGYEVELEGDELAKFIETYGPAIVSGPKHQPFEGRWHIWVNSGRKFTQS